MLLYTAASCDACRCSTSTTPLFCSDVYSIRAASLSGWNAYGVVVMRHSTTRDGKSRKAMKA